MNFIKKFLPILQWLPNYQRGHFSGDVYAGLTVGIMLIPQGMAYALIAGLPPVYGLYASIVPQIIYAIFGTSRQLSVAPVAMDSLLVAAGVSVLATEGTDAYIGFAILLAFFMGLFQLLLGVFRMGFITNLLSKPVISGFTSAAALIIGLNQLKYLIGVDIEKSNKIYEVLWSALSNVNQTHLLTLLIGVFGILVIVLIRRFNSRIPGSLLAVVFGILIVYGFNLHLEGVSIVESIPEGLPPFELPNFDLGKWSELIPLALTISVVAFMEAYSVAKTIETKRKDYKVIANQELIGLGAANLIGSLFQSYPVTGGFSRSAVNDQAGANTPLSSIISAALIALTLLFLTPLFYYLPTAILASIIMVAVYRLIDFRYARTLLKDHKVEFVLFLVTFLVTLNFSMVPGIVSGVVLSILILLYRSAYPHIAKLGRIKGQSDFRNLKRFKNLEVWKDKLIIRVDAPLTFINIQFIKDYIEDELSKSPEIQYLIFDAASVSHLDATAANGITELLIEFKDKGIILVITDVIGPVRDILFDTGLLELIGEEHMYLTLNDAIESLNSGEKYDKTIAAIQHGIISDEED